MQSTVLSSHQEPHADTWHYLDSRDEKHEENYIEWKYFNFTQDDLAGYIIYYIIDPEKKTKLGNGRLLVRILKQGKSYGLIKRIDMNEVDLDAVSASMHMGPARITEKNNYEYEISCQDEDFSWNLNYKQSAPTIESFQNINLTSLMRWEKVNWLIKMPRAKVTGDIQIGKEIFHIDAFGYSDTNWGQMVPFFTKYEWGQYNDKDFSLVFGVLFGFFSMKSSYFYFVLRGHLVAMEKSKCEIRHLKWSYDSSIGTKIPSRSSFSAKEGEYEIEFTTHLLYSDDPGMKIHPLLPKVVVSEQIVEYEGVVKSSGEILHSFKGRGFQEWTTKTWRKLSLTF